MNRRKGFTLVELMVVILIVGILAAVAIPIMRGRIDAAKWSEGKAMMGTIATAIRAYVAQTNEDINQMTNVTFAQLGFASGDLTGTYFRDGDFAITGGSYNVETNVLTYTIQATADSAHSGINSPVIVTLNQAGVWTESTPP